MTTVEMKVVTVNGATHAVTLDDAHTRGRMRITAAGMHEVFVVPDDPYLCTMAACVDWDIRVKAIDLVARDGDAATTREPPGTDAASLAFDAIAALCGAPHWDYPGQIVRDVEALVGERDRAREATAPRTKPPTPGEVRAMEKVWRGVDTPDMGEDAALMLCVCRNVAHRWCETVWVRAEGDVVVGFDHEACVALDTAERYLFLGPDGPVPWPVVAALAAAEAGPPVDVATLVDALAFTESLHLMARDALRNAAPHLAARGVDRYDALTWGLVAQGRFIERRQLWAESRSGVWGFVAIASEEPFVRPLNDTHAAIVERDPDCGNVLHIVDADKRRDDLAERAQREHDVPGGR